MKTLRGKGPVNLLGAAPTPGPVRSVYVHAPFCSSRCPYCDFSVTVLPRGDLPGWLAALEQDLAAVREGRFFWPEGALDTLFVGGGTPSLLGPEAMAGLKGVLGQERFSDPGLEWTSEANPESFSSELARAWASAGVNRVSLGIQSFQESALNWLRRIHGPQEAEDAIRRAREAGIRNVSLDLIFGLPREATRDWGRDLDSALSFEPQHLSLYGLSVENGTPLALAIDSGGVSAPEEGRYRDQYLEASERLSGEGYCHYEVSNFALPGFEARHNRVYWDREPYLGLGNSAHSFRDPFRRWNLGEWAAYREACLTGAPPWDSEEALAPGDVRLEKIWLGLRTDRGLEVGSLRQEVSALVDGWAAVGTAEREGEIVRLTPEGWLLLDQLVVELDLAMGQKKGSRGRHGLTLPPGVFDLSMR